jgi:D-alanyl-D-alanine carboxypeptidase
MACFGTGDEARPCLSGPLVSLVLLATFAVLPGCEPDVPSFAATVRERLQGTVDSLRATAGFPGATAAVVMPDGAEHTAATGWADRDDSTRMLPDARMLGGSTGKSFVAAVVLSLVQEGTVAFDIPVSRWLGDRPWFDRLPNADALTLRVLLRHQSGLVDHIHSEAFRRTMQQKRAAEGPDAALSPDEVVRLGLGTDPLFPVGTGYHYSDTNYILAGMTIEAATSRAYYDLLRERFLGPLELSDTGPSDRRALPGLAAGYIRGEAPFGLPPTVAQDGVLVYNPATEWTGGGLVTTARDLARWAKALYEGEALSGAYLGLLLDAVPKDSTQRARYGDNVRYGLGVTIRSTPLGPAYGHRGWTPGYLSVFEYYPDHEVAVAMQVNETGPYDLARYAVHLGRVAVSAASQ